MARERMFGVRVTDTEYQAINTKAKAAGKTTAEFLRDLALEAGPSSLQRIEAKVDLLLDSDAIHDCGTAMVCPRLECASDPVREILEVIARKAFRAGKNVVNGISPEFGGDALDEDATVNWLLGVLADV